MVRFMSLAAAMFFLLTGAARAEVWRSIDVATFTVGADVIRGKARNRIISIEATGPPRSVAAAQKSVTDYAVESVNMALASAEAAFYGTVGDLSAKATAAIGAFKSMILVRIYKNPAMSSMEFDIHYAEREVDSDSINAEFHNPAAVIDAEAGEAMKKAFPSAAQQIAQIHDAYAYIERLQHPDVAFSVNIKEIANRLDVPRDFVADAPQKAQELAADGGKATNDALQQATAQITDGTDHATKELNDAAARVEAEAAAAAQHAAEQAAQAAQQAAQAAADAAQRANQAAAEAAQRAAQAAQDLGGRAQDTINHAFGR